MYGKDYRQIQCCVIKNIIGKIERGIRGHNLELKDGEVPRGSDVKVECPGTTTVSGLDAGISILALH